MKKLISVLLLAFLLGQIAYADPAERSILSTVKPAYPPVAKEMKIGGTVKLRVTIDAKGVVTKTETLGGNPMLVDPAVKAVRQWKYAPAAESSSTVISIIFNPVQ